MGRYAVNTDRWARDRYIRVTRYPKCAYIGRSGCRHFPELLYSFEIYHEVLLSSSWLECQRGWLQYLVILDEDKVARCKQVDIPGFNERSSPTAERCLVRKRNENDSFAHKYVYPYQPMTATPSLPLVSWGEHQPGPAQMAAARLCLHHPKRRWRFGHRKTSPGPTPASLTAPSWCTRGSLLG